MNLNDIKKKLHGPIFPTITPFKEGPSYEVDYEALKNYIDFYMTPAPEHSMS